MAAPARIRARILWPLWVAAIFSSLSVVRVGTDWLRGRNLLRLTVSGLFVLALGLLVVALLRHARFRRWRLLPVLLGGAGLAALVAMPSPTPEERLHLLEYGGLALLTELALPETWSARRRFAVAFLTTLLVGWCDELVQGLLPTRHYDAHDVLLNAESGLLALLIRQAVLKALPPVAAPVPAPAASSHAPSQSSGLPSG